MSAGRATVDVKSESTVDGFIFNGEDKRVTVPRATGTPEELADYVAVDCNLYRSPVMWTTLTLHGFRWGWEPQGAREQRSWQISPTRRGLFRPQAMFSTAVPLG
jgi:hypothetical protein